MRILARLGRWLAIATLVLMAVVAVVTFALIHYPHALITDRRGPDELRVLDQGWTSSDRERYYYTPQGTSLKGLRYRWFTSLEIPWGHQLFSDPNHLRAYGFLVDPAPSPRNPDHLPVGFTRHFDPVRQEDLLDFTCAACHTGQVDVLKNGRRYGIRIDGGPAMHALTSVKFGHFGPVLLGSMASTYLNPWKFDRFAHRVLGPAYSSPNRRQLGRDFRDVLLALLSQTWSDTSRHLYPVEEGYGRTDALGRISNTVFGDQLDPVNYRVANAPVSYPYLWNIWKFDWVQYTASVSQPMARNMGEALGVGATLHLADTYGRPFPPGQRFWSSVRVENLHRIESTLQKLTPPRWPEDLLGAVDREKAERGRILFESHCRPCHGPHVVDATKRQSIEPLRTDNDPMWSIDALSLLDIGTDPTSAMNFTLNRLDLRRSGMTIQEVRALVRPVLEEQLRRQLEIVPEAERAAKRAEGEARIEHQLASIDLSHVPLGAALNYVGLALRAKDYAARRYTPQEQQCLDGFGALDVPQVQAAYKPRPLAGVWATGPFLHNGSVPTLYQLLSPVTERDQRFFVGGNDFDPQQVGIVRTPRPGINGFWFDTSLPGNSNVGHEFRAGYIPWSPNAPPQYGAIGPELTPDERWALVEYLKIHEDPPTPPRTPPTCGLREGTDS
jgi:hypothetical protein